MIYEIDFSLKYKNSPIKPGCFVFAGNIRLFVLRSYLIHYCVNLIEIPYIQIESRLYDTVYIFS